MSEFFDMSGYARYVWPSIALGFGVVVLNLVLAWSSLRRAQAQARRRLEMQS
jgi:heme exporter protein CcmD